MSFQNVYTKNIPGMIAFACNTLGLNGACSSFTDVFTGCNQPGKSGISGAWISTDKTMQANDNWRQFVSSLPQVDTIGGTTFDYTKNSSSCKLNIPYGSIIDYAILIWSGNSKSQIIDVSSKEINFTDSLGNIYNIAPQYSFTNDSSYGYYTCAKEVTDIIRLSRSGYYTVGNVYSEFDTNVANAGWILYAVYSAPEYSYVHININVGNLDVIGGQSKTNELYGFQTPENDSVSAGIILTAIGGNPASTGDKVSLSDKDENETYLLGAYNPKDNFFGSQLLNIMAKINTDATFGNLNTTPNQLQVTDGRRIGYDCTLVDAGIALSNNQNKTTLKVSTTGNNYSLTSTTLIVKNTFPSFDITTTSSTNYIILGEEFVINYEIENKGTTNSETFNMTYKDDGLEFVKGYYEIGESKIELNETPNNLSLPNLDVSEKMIVSLTYKTDKIPDDLAYQNTTFFNYTFQLGDIETGENTIPKNLIIDIMYASLSQSYNLNPVEIIPPLINIDREFLQYTVYNEPIDGEVEIVDGIIIYTPKVLKEGTNRFIINVLNTQTQKNIKLVYDIKQNVIPNISKTITHEDSVELYSNINVNIIFENKSDFAYEQVYIWPSLSPGLLLLQGALVNENNERINITREVNKFYLGNLEPRTSYNIEFIYQAVKIPTDLAYCIGSYGTFYMGYVHFGQLDGSKLEEPYIITPICKENIELYKNTTYTSQIPIIEINYEYLSYSIKTQGSKGSAFINEEGFFTYTPDINALGYDEVIISIENSQQSKTLEMIYKFYIDEYIDTNTHLSYKLLKLLNENIYLLNTKSYDYICFNCDIWTNGYIDKSKNIEIMPVKDSLIKLLDELIEKLNDILVNTVYRNIYNNNGFKAQVDRFLYVIKELKSKIRAISCRDSCDNSIYSYFVSLLSDTINALVRAYSLLDALVYPSEKHCTNCNKHLEYLMPIYVNTVSYLQEISKSYNSLLVYFTQIATMQDKSYNPVYFPKFNKY